MNFDFSGMFGGGFTNNLNKNNFNFSAYAPKKEELVVDPIDVVSNKTPEAKVEILEGAGTVAITKADPVQQAIESLRGKDLTQSFNVNPMADMTAAPVTENIDNNIRNTVQNLTAEQPVETFEPIQESIGTSNILKAVEQSPVDYSGMTWEDLQEQRLSGNGFSLNKEFVEQDQASREADLNDQGLMFQAGLGEDLRQDYNPNDQFTTGAMGEVVRSGNQADFKNLVDQGTVNRLAELGLKADYKQDKYKGYRYNPETGGYDYYDNTPSMIEQAAPALIKAGVMTAATAGLGSALAGSSAVTGIAGGNTALATGLGQGIAGGLSTAIQGGDTGDILQSVISGAVGGYTEGLNTLTSDAEYMLGLADQGAELVAHAETMNTVMDVVDLAQAVDEKDVLAALDAGLSLGGMNSSTELLTGKLEEAYGLDSFVGTNASVLSSAGLKAAVDIAGGADAGEVLQNTANSIIKDTIVTEDNVRELLGGYAADGSYIGNNLDPLTKAFTSVAHAGLEGKSREEMAGKFVKAYIEAGGQILPQSEESSDSQAFKDLEAWYHENIEDPLEQYWQDIEPYRERIETQLQAVGDLANTYIIDPAKRLVSTVAEQADSIVRALPSEKEDWENLEDIIKDNVIDPAASTVRETGRTVREWMPDGEGVDIELPSLPDLPDLDFDIPFEFEPEFSMEIKNIDYLYDDSDIIRNPLLSSTPTRVRNLAESIEIDKKRQEQVARRSSANEDKERIKRSKNLYKGKVGGTVRYTG